MTEREMEGVCVGGWSPLGQIPQSDQVSTFRNTSVPAQTLALTLALIGRRRLTSGR